jgi:hypothetical protein
MDDELRKEIGDFVAEVVGPIVGEQIKFLRLRVEHLERGMELLKSSERARANRELVGFNGEDDDE